MENPVCGKQAKILAEWRWEKVYNNQNQHYITSNLQIRLFSDSVHVCECIAVRGYFILNLSLTVIKKNNNFTLDILLLCSQQKTGSQVT